MHRLITALGVWFALSPLAAYEALEEVARLEQAPGNITLTPEGRIVLSLHPFYTPRWRVAELGEDGDLRPFPNPFWAAGGGGGLTLDSVLGIQSDPRGVVWMLDNGLRSGTTPKLLAWDTRKGRLAGLIALPPPATVPDSFVNDLAVDAERGVIYISDPARGAEAALIVVEVSSGRARRVLQGHHSVVAEDVDLMVDGTPVRAPGPQGEPIAPRIGVNPIALDAHNRWLYFGPMHGTALYRVATRDLLDRTLSGEALGSRVQRYADRPVCDGISTDAAGNIYITDIANNAIGVIDTQRRYRTLVPDARLSWPDALSFGPDGLLYIVANKLHKTARLNAGRDEARPPYYVLRVRPLAPGTVGR